RGMEVTVVHLAGWLLERQLDPVAGAMLQASLEARGLQFRLDTSTSAIVGNEAGEVAAVRFSNGDEIPADLVVMAAGIRPNTALAQEAGIHCNRGIVVNDSLQTYDPRVYAVGECASHRGVAYGLVAPLFEQARVCANHLATFGIGIYRGSTVATTLRVTGTDLVCACLYGDTSDGAWYFKQIKDGTAIGERRDTLAFGELAMGESGTAGQDRAAAMADADEVCGCNGVCKGTIVKAVREQGLFTVDEVKKHTKAASSCGSCTRLV